MYIKKEVMYFEWIPIISSIISFVFGGGLLAVIMEWRYRKLNKKVKQSKSSSESYLDYERVIDSNTVRIEDMRKKHDKLFNAIDISKKTNSILKLKIFEYRQFIKNIDKKYNLRDNHMYESFFIDFDSETDLYDKYDFSVD